MYALLSDLWYHWLAAVSVTNRFSHGPTIALSSEDKVSAMSAVEVRIASIDVITCQSTGFAPQDACNPLFKALAVAQSTRTLLNWSCVFFLLLVKRNVCAAEANHYRATSTLWFCSPYVSSSVILPKGSGAAVSSISSFEIEPLLKGTRHSVEANFSPERRRTVKLWLAA